MTASCWAGLPPAHGDILAVAPGPMSGGMPAPVPGLAFALEKDGNFVC